MEFSLYKKIASLAAGLALAFTATAQAETSTATLTASLPLHASCQLTSTTNFTFGPLTAMQALTADATSATVFWNCSEAPTSLTLSDGRQAGSSADFLLQNGSSTTNQIPFTISSGGTPILNDGAGLTVLNAGNTGVNLSAAIDVANAAPGGYPSGTYSDTVTATLTFT
jgi:spore coat protein U-like protein